MKHVLYRYRDSESVIKAMEGYTPGEGWTPLYDQAAIDAAWAAAWAAARDATRDATWAVADLKATIRDLSHF